MNFETMGPLVYVNPDPGHEPVLNPQSSPGSILVTDNALFRDISGTTGFTGIFGPSFAPTSAGSVDSNQWMVPWATSCPPVSMKCTMTVPYGGCRYPK
jgi:hypothetical protein